jgi:two-component system cell cycle response regulator
MLRMSSKPKILIVEDDPITLDALTRVLSSDFEVLGAGRPSEGLALLRENRIEVLLSDYSLPEMSGAQFLKVAHETSPLTVRAVITGYHDLDRLARDLSEQNVHRFLMKPWDNLVLTHQIQECVQFHRVLAERANLASLSYTDSKTGLFNDRYFKERLQVEMDRARRHKRPLCLILIDFDHFKEFNDNHGHPAGDKLLAHFAQHLKKSLRTIDICARYGGDEFAVILPDTDTQQALPIAERLRTQFQQKELSLSLGLCELKQDVKDQNDFLELADKALYQAKNQGRDQTIVAGTTA